MTAISISRDRLLPLLLIGLFLLIMGKGYAIDFVSAKGYRCAIPSGWHAGMLPVSGPDIVLFGPRRPDGTPNITIVTNDAGGATLDQIKEAVNRNNLHPQQGYRRVSQTTRSLNGDMALETVVEYLLPAPLGRTEAKQEIILRNGREYEFTCTASVPGFTEIEGLFVSLLKTLKWMPPATEFTASDVKRAYYGKESYALIPPPGWRVDESGLQTNGNIVLAGPADHDRSPNISIHVGTADPGQSIDAEQESLQTTLPKLFPNYMLKSQVITTVDDVPTLETCYSLGDASNTLYGCQAYVLKGGKVYLITGTFPFVGREVYEALFTRVMQSWRWAN